MQEVEVLKIKAIEEVKSIKDLKDNISILKKEMEGMDMASEDYNKHVRELQVNQNALKDAMYATKSTLQETIQGAQGVAQSYNGLVHRMAELKSELRATDVSTDQGRARFNALAAEIDGVNNRLKEMDALQGNFQRNVGNYEGALKSWSNSLDGLDKGLKIASGGIGSMKAAADGLAKAPLFTLVGILVTAFSKLAAEMKNNEDSMAALKSAAKGFEPVLKFFQGLLERITDIIAGLIGQVASWIGSSGLFLKLERGLMGVGNAILKFVVAPFKGVAAAIKVFQEEGVKGLGKAAKAFGQEMKNGVSFKENFQAGAASADAIIAGVKSKRKDVQAAAKEEAQVAAQSWEEEWARVFAKGEAVAEARRKAREAELKEEADFYDKYIDQTEDFTAELDALNQESIQKDLDARRKAEAEKEAIQEAGVAGALSVMSSLADIYEANAGEDEKAAKRVKAIRISTGIIDTLTGAIKALTSAPNPVLGGIQAAAVTAAGMANVAKIRATQVGAASLETATAPALAMAPAPEVATQFPSSRLLTGASQEERLNKVVLVTSELEAFQAGTQATLQEASF